MSKSITPLSEIGLFGLMDRYEKIFPKQQSGTIKGMENDAAIIDAGSTSLVTGQTMLLEGIHFDLTYFPLKHLGYKSVISAISEVIASGCRPTQITISLGLSGKMSLEAVDQLMEGVKMACDKYNIDLIGFKPSSSLTGLTISVTAYGISPKDKPLSRAGALENDILCVTGDLGSAFMGLQLLEREKKVLNETAEAMPDFGSYDYLLERQLKPEARIELLKQLEETGIWPTSMILIRESLAAALIRLCQTSKVGCTIYENKIPIDHTTSTLCDEMEFNPMVAALNGGEDYEILFSLSLDDYKKVEEAGNQLNNVFLIGYVCPATKGYTLETNAGQEIPLKARGWGEKEK
ncbi:thiamine-phosphate kinase [Thermophagus sp. OGC60D27]|uniref:thiamine-phosphate kinase n=1 Tax=Thermophagus sp. OGC60D27 TaxID=3458415 RepID=UPI004037EBCD